MIDGGQIHGEEEPGRSPLGEHWEREDHEVPTLLFSPVVLPRQYFHGVELFPPGMSPACGKKYRYNYASLSCHSETAARLIRDLY